MINLEQTIAALCNRLGVPEKRREHGGQPTAHWGTGWSPAVGVRFNAKYNCVQVSMRGTNETAIDLYVAESIEHFADAIVRCLAPGVGIVAPIEVVVEAAARVLGAGETTACRRMSFDEVVRAMSEALGPPSQYNTTCGACWLGTFMHAKGHDYEAPAVLLEHGADGSVLVKLIQWGGEVYAHTIVETMRVPVAAECMTADVVVTRSGTCTLAVAIKAALATRLVMG